MTDNEIIKALECCSTGETYADCEKNGCPLYLGITMGCKYIDKENQLYSDALDLINRKQAEIERLRKEVNLVSIQFQDLQERYEEAHAEIEQWKEEANKYQKLWCIAMDDIEIAQSGQYKILQRG